VWEEPPYETGHEPFSRAVPTGAIVDTCTGIIGNYDPDEGERCAAAFKQALPMAAIMQRAVEETCGPLS